MGKPHNFYELIAAIVSFSLEGLVSKIKNQIHFRVSEEKKCAFKSHPWHVNLEINAVDMMYTSYSVT